MKSFVKPFLNPIHRDLLIALVMGFIAALGIASLIVLIFA